MPPPEIKPRFSRRPARNLVIILTEQPLPRSVLNLVFLLKYVFNRLIYYISFWRTRHVQEVVTFGRLGTGKLGYVCSARSERCAVAVAASCSGGPEFSSRPGDMMFRLKFFMVLLSSFWGSSLSATADSFRALSS
jgi:hypothetical protein